MHEKIQNQIKDALKAGDQVRLITLRGALTAFTNESVALGRTPQDKLSDEESLTVLRRLSKQRKDAIEQFENGGRKDLADNERAELKVIEEFLPDQMPEEEVRVIAQKILRQAQDDNSPILKNKGAFIGAIIKETHGQADGAIVKKVIEELLS